MAAGAYTNTCLSMVRPQAIADLTGPIFSASMAAYTATCEIPIYITIRLI
jgi:hypothetical protein